MVDQYLLGNCLALTYYIKNISYADEDWERIIYLGFTVKINQSVKGKIDEAEIKRFSGENEDGMKDVLKNNDAIESAEFTFGLFGLVAPKY